MILCIVVVFLILLRYTNGLKKMLDHYHKLMGTLNEAETQLLDDHIQNLWKIFKSGHSRLNWKSVGNGDLNADFQFKNIFNSALYFLHHMTAMYP